VKLLEDPGVLFAGTMGGCFLALYLMLVYVVTRMWSLGNRVKELESRHDQSVDVGCGADRGVAGGVPPLAGGS
jgi:hypothetical protein